MNALTAIYNVAKTTLPNAKLRYCLMDYSKLPHKVDGSLAHSNNNDDFVPLLEICKCKKLSEYKTLAVSIWASNICAIDIDHCLTKENDITTLSDLAKDIVSMFKDFAYIEYSFSGLGLRILFRQANVQNYAENYYIKNSKLGLEYYQPSESARYVSITGNVIYDNNVDSNIDKSLVILNFLQKYMRRASNLRQNVIETEETRSFDELMKIVKHLYMTDYSFQNLWFSVAPGSNSDESERDYRLIAMLYENVTTNRTMIRLLFEESKFFKTKDYKHRQKWERSDYRYYNRQYDEVAKRH